MDEQESNLEVVRSLGELWNAGDYGGLMEHYSDDIEVITDPEWPDASTTGKEAFARTTDEWRGAWQSVEIVVGDLRAVGADRVLAGGTWQSVGAASGIGGSLPFWILYTLRDGLIVRMQWFMHEADARAAAGL